MMNIILLDDVLNLGFKNDVVKVRDGYAQNYLIPQGLALPATKANLKVLAENVRQASHRQQALLEEAQTKANALKDLSVKIEMLVGKGGRIYGAVTPLQIAQQLKEQGVEVDRRKIKVPEDAKEVGTYTALVVLHKEVQTELNFEIVAKDVEA